jgi:hypothetical protein
VSNQGPAPATVCAAAPEGPPTNTASSSASADRPGIRQPPREPFVRSVMTTIHEYRAGEINPASRRRNRFLYRLYRHRARLTIA